MSSPDNSSIDEDSGEEYEQSEDEADYQSRGETDDDEGESSIDEPQSSEKSFVQYSDLQLDDTSCTPPPKAEELSTDDYAIESQSHNTGDQPPHTENGSQQTDTLPTSPTAPDTTYEDTPYHKRKVMKTCVSCDIFEECDEGDPGNNVHYCDRCDEINGVDQPWKAGGKQQLNATHKAKNLIDSRKMYHNPKREYPKWQQYPKHEQKADVQPAWNNRATTAHTPSPKVASNWYSDNWDNSSNNSYDPKWQSRTKSNSGKGGKSKGYKGGKYAGNTNTQNLSTKSNSGGGAFSFTVCQNNIKVNVADKEINLQPCAQTSDFIYILSLIQSLKD